MQAGLDILLIEDNDSLSENIAEYFEGRGHRIDFAYDGRAGLATALASSFDAVILDLSLPRLDGLRVCQEIRARANRHVPILMLTARDTLDDKLQGFDCGADDYLTKPFELAELAARCEALSKRHQVGTNHLIEIGSLRLDRREKEAAREDKRLRLTPITFQILRTLAEAYPAAVSRHELMRQLWGEDPGSDQRHQRRAAHPTHAGDEHARLLEAFLFVGGDEAAVTLVRLSSSSPK